MCLAGVIAAMWVLSQFSGREVHLVSTLLSAPVLLLASYMVVRYGLTEVELSARGVMMKFLGMAILFFVSTNVIYHRWQFHWLVWILVALGALAALEGLRQWLMNGWGNAISVTGLMGKKAIRGPFASSAEFAVFLHMMFSVVVSLFLFSRYPLSLKMVCAFVAGIIGLALVATGQAQYWVGWVLSITVLGIYLLRKRGWKFRWALLGASVLLLVVGAAWLAAYKLEVMAPSPVRAHVETLETTGTVSPIAPASPSVPLWRSALTMALRNPLMGVGLGMFEWRYPFYRGQQGTPTDAGNDWLGIFVESGFIGVVLTVWVAVAFVVAAVQILNARARRYSASTASNRYAYVVAGLAAFVAVVVDGLLMKGFGACGNQLVLLTIMAITLTSALHNRNDNPEKSHTPGKLTLFRLTGVHRVLLTAGSILLLLLFLWLVITTCPGEVFLSRAQQYALHREWSEAEAFYRRAIRSDPRNYQALVGLGDLYVARAAMDSDEALALREQALSRYQQAIILNPYAYELRIKMGQLYDVLGSREKAEEQYKLALQGDPRNGLYHEATAGHYQRWGETGQAEQHFRLAAKLKAISTLSVPRIEEPEEVSPFDVMP